MVKRKDIYEHLSENAIRHSVLMVNGIRETSFTIEKLFFDLQCAKEIITQEMSKVKYEIANNSLVFSVDELDFFLGHKLSNFSAK